MSSERKIARASSAFVGRIIMRCQRSAKAIPPFRGQTLLCPQPKPSLPLGKTHQTALHTPHLPGSVRPGHPVEAAVRVRFLPLPLTYISTVSDGCSLRHSLGTGSQDREPPRSKKRDCVCRSGPHPKTNSVTARNAAGSAYMIHVKPSRVSHRAVLPTAPRLGNWLPYVCSVPREATPT